MSIRTTSSAPAVWMMVGALISSVFPIFVEIMHTDSPLLLAGGLGVGQSVGVTLYLALFHRRLVADRPTLRLLLRRGLPIGFATDDQRQRMFTRLSLFGVFAQLNAVAYIFSTRFVDTAITAILVATWPILFVLVLSKQNRNTRRYDKVTSGKLAAFAFAFIGIAFVVMGATGQAPDAAPETPLAGQLVGIFLALLSPVLGALSAKSFKWGFEVRSDLLDSGHSQAIANPHSTEMACMMFSYGISTLGASLVAIGTSVMVGESADGALLLVAVVYGMLMRFPSILCVRAANLNTRDLMVNTLSYATPLLALLWLYLFSDIQVARIDYVVMGASAVIAVNLLLNLGSVGGASRFALKPLVLALWSCGVVVFLRDRWFDVEVAWGGGRYWGAVALLSAMFALGVRRSTRSQSADGAGTTADAPASTSVTLGCLTVALLLLARPEVSGWIGFLTEVIAVMLAATVILLVINLANLRLRRGVDVQRTGSLMDSHGDVADTFSRRNRVIGRNLSLIVGLGILMAFGALLYFKWLDLTTYAGWWA